MSRGTRGSTREAGPVKDAEAPGGARGAPCEARGAPGGARVSERAGSERAGSERAGSERAGSERAGSERDRSAGSAGSGEKIPEHPLAGRAQGGRKIRAGFERRPAGALEAPFEGPRGSGFFLVPRVGPL